VIALQAHVAGGLSGPHHSGGHGLPPVMLHYVSPQQGAGANPQHGPQQGAPQHFYIGHPQGTGPPGHTALYRQTAQLQSGLFK